MINKTPVKNWRQTKELINFEEEVSALTDERLIEVYSFLDPTTHELGRLAYWAKSLLALQSHISAYKMIMYIELKNRGLI